jgi:hypothetical protein
MGQRPARSLRAGSVAACACILAFLGLAATASATTFKGPTTQGKTMKLTVDKAGKPVKANYVWDMDCAAGGTLSDGGTVSSNFPKADADGFRSSGTYTADVERKFEAEIRVRIEGDRASDTRFTGSFKLKAKVFDQRSGELVARCNTGVVRWSADLKGQAPVPEPPVTPRFHAG